MTIKTQRLLGRAKKLINKGKNNEAEKLFLEILESFPNNQQAKRGLHLLNQNKETKLTQLQLNEVIQLYSSGFIEDALLKIAALIKNYPYEPSLFNICGICFGAIDDQESAVLNFKKAINLNPKYPEAQYNLGATYHKMGQLNNAIESYSKAITINNAYPTAHNNLGQILLELGKFDNAIEHFEWAISFKPDFAEAHNNLGAALQKLRQFDDSLLSYEKAVTVNPKYAQALNNLGILHQTLGKKKSAIDYYKKAISIREDFASAHQNLSGLKKYTKIDEQVKTMELLLSNEKLNQSEKVYLNFALAKVYDDLGEHEKLFKFLHEGNRLRNLELNFSLDKYRDNYSFFKNLFSSSAVIKSEPLASKKSPIRPIFIVGMPRSGTSLVEQIIASHSKVYGAGELHTITKIVNDLYKDDLAIDKENMSEVFLSIQEKYIDSLSNLKVSEKIITDKWPLNFQYIGFILKSFPNAKIIHLKRNSMAICWSIYKHYFSDEGNGWAYNINDLTGFYGLYIELMDYWHKLYPNQIYDLCYEDLTNNQEEETRKLLKYCELDWDENCLKFQDNNRIVMTASALQVRKKMYQGSSDQWKRYKTYLQPLFKKIRSLEASK